MKNRIITAVLLTILACGTGCTDMKTKLFPEKKPKRATSVLVDITGKEKPYEDPQAIVQTLGISQETLYDGFFFRGGFVSSEDRPITQYVVQPEHWLFGEQVRQVQAIKKFRADVIKALNTLEAETEEPKPYSMVAKNIAREIHALKNTGCEVRSLICLSDLLESGQEFSYYRKADFNKAQRQPECVAASFQERYPLPKNSGVTVYFIYQPKDYEEQVKYDVALKVMTAWMEGQGVKVIASPNLIIQ